MHQYAASQITFASTLAGLQQWLSGVAQLLKGLVETAALPESSEVPYVSQTRHMLSAECAHAAAATAAVVCSP